MSGRRLRHGIVVAACVLWTATGCGTDPFIPEQVSLPCPANSGGPLTLVVGARANSPEPTLPPEIQGLVREAAKQSSRIQIVRVDGEPTVAVDATFRTNAQNDPLRRRHLDTFVSQTLAAAAGLKPKKGEADVQGALTVAARATPDGGTVVLLDSGLSTTGQLSFLGGAMFGVDPAEAVKYLQDQQLMPDLTGRSVVLVGMGNTANPQPALDENLRSRVTALWHTITTKANAACVHDLDTVAGRTSVDTTVPVTVVSLPPRPSFKPCGTTILADSDTVGFRPDQAVFRDPAAARATLEGLADQLRKGTQLAKLTGTTSSGPTAIGGNSEAARITLSLQRARAVKDVLISLGVPADRLTTEGAGSHWPNRVNDRGPDGNLLPGPAAQNRSVVVELICKSS